MEALLDALFNDVALSYKAIGIIVGVIAAGLWIVGYVENYRH